MSLRSLIQTNSSVLLLLIVPLLPDRGLEVSLMEPFFFRRDFF
ncbi:hypothetical protein ACWE42_19300 [Sutcliffiella cohnii]